MQLLPARVRNAFRFALVSATPTFAMAAQGNGRKLFRGLHSRQVVDGKSVPPARGKISIQPEGAAAFFRNIVIRKLDPAAAQYPHLKRN